MQLNNIKEALEINPKLESIFIGDIITKSCYEVGLSFDNTFNIDKDFDQYTVDIQQIIFTSPLIYDEISGVIESCEFRVMYNFERIKNEVLISQNALNLKIKVENNKYVVIKYWLSGTTIVNDLLFSDIKNSLLQAASIVFENNHNISKSEQNIEIYNTEVKEYKEGIGWIEAWYFVELKTKTYACIMIKFDNAEDGGVNFNIFI